MNEESEKDARCNDRLTVEGETHTCDLPLGHSGPHESEEMEWWESK